MVKNVWGLHLTITRIFLTGTTTIRARRNSSSGQRESRDGGSTKSSPCSPRAAAPEVLRRPRAPSLCARGCAAPAPPGALRSSRGEEMAAGGREGKETFPRRQVIKTPEKSCLPLPSGSGHKRRRLSRRAKGGGGCLGPARNRTPAQPGEFSASPPRSVPAGRGQRDAAGSSRGFVPRGTKPAGRRPGSETRSSLLRAGKLLTASLVHCRRAGCKPARL